MDSSNIKQITSFDRSISLPINPQQLENKVLQRSKEKEIVYEEEDEPPANSSANNFLYPNGWTGSTIELNAELHQNELRKSRKGPHRVIEKNGHENVIFRRIPDKTKRYFQDYLTTLIELDWTYMLSMFVASYCFNWIFFAILSYLVVYSHGDLLFDETTGERLGEGKQPCIMGVRNFVSILIYSIEIQTTVGYGERYPSEECVESIFLYIMQIICSICIEGGMISIIYAKTARPAKQMTKLKFSDKAVICYRDGKLCLLFRVCDPRQQQTIESKIRVTMIVDRSTTEGEVIKTHTQLKLEGNGQQIIVWPEIVCHVIDRTSPLYGFTSARKFNAGQFELFVSIAGISNATAQITEATTSYVPSEIFWGQRFVNIISYDVLQERYVIDYSRFNTTISVDMINTESDCGPIVNSTHIVCMPRIPRKKSHPARGHNSTPVLNMQN